MATPTASPPPLGSRLASLLALQPFKPLYKLPQCVTTPSQLHHSLTTKRLASSPQVLTYVDAHSHCHPAEPLTKAPPPVWEAVAHLTSDVSAPERGLASFVNPTNKTISANITIPLYYTGLPPGTALTATWSQANAKSVPATTVNTHPSLSSPC